MGLETRQKKILNYYVGKECKPLDHSKKGNIPLFHFDTIQIFRIVAEMVLNRKINLGEFLDFDLWDELEKRIFIWKETGQVLLKRSDGLFILKNETECKIILNPLTGVVRKL